MTKIDSRDDRFLEMIVEMCVAYLDNFRGSTFFTDYTKDECQDLIAYAENKQNKSRGEISNAVWHGIVQLAQGCLDDFEEIENESETS